MISGLLALETCHEEDGKNVGMPIVDVGVEDGSRRERRMQPELSGQLEDKGAMAQALSLFLMDIGLAKIEIIYNHTVTYELRVYRWHTALSKYIWWAGVIFGYVWPDLHWQFPSGQMWLAQFC